jgi:hypothetical protein
MNQATNFEGLTPTERHDLQRVADALRAVNTGRTFDATEIDAIAQRHPNIRTALPELFTGNIA